MKRWFFVWLLMALLACEQEPPVDVNRKLISPDRISWQDGWAKDILSHHQDSFTVKGNLSVAMFHPLGVTDLYCKGSCDEVMLNYLRSMANQTLDGVYMDRAERILYNRYATSDEDLPDARHLMAFERNDSVWINLFLPAEIRSTGPGDDWTVTVETDYPKDGEIRIRVDGPEEAEWTLAFRQPGWTDNRPDPLVSYRWRTNRKLVADLNGEYLYPELRDGYAYLTRRWKPGEEVAIHLPMSVRRVINSQGQVPLISMEYGPVVLAANNNPEALEALPDQGIFMMSSESSGSDTWTFQVDDHPLKFVRWPEQAAGSPGKIQWKIRQ